jgi:uncharacterized protein YjbI with pentapeptide repeats
VLTPRAPRLEDEAELAVLGPEGAHDARLLDVDVSGARLRGLRLADVVVERGNLANLVAPEASLQRVVFTGARLTGLQLTRAKVTDVVFRDCRIDLATFAGTTFERVAFEGCLLNQAEYREALWRSVRLEHCDLSQADLTRLRIDGAELRGCTLEAVVALERLRGAAMPWTDIVGHAGEFAAALGIRLLDPPVVEVLDP